MQQRVIGLPLLIGQPATGIIDSNEFVERICGFIVYATVRNDSLIAVARVLSNDAVAILDAGISAAPACQFSSDDFVHVNADGTPLLIEPKPSYISHISLVPVGDSTAGISVIQQEAINA